MGTKYTSESITGYDASPPADDGSSTEANKVKWATIKEKLPDPLKTAIENINTKLVNWSDTGVDSKTASSVSVSASDNGKLLAFDTSSNAITANLAAASTLGDGWECVFTLVDATNSLTVDPNGSETINGSATITLDSAYSSLIIRCDGSNFTAIKVVVTGTAAVEDIGTSGDALGKLNANKTDSGSNIFTGTNQFTGVLQGESSSNVFRAKISDDSNTDVFRVIDSNGNTVGSLDAITLDGAGGGKLQFTGWDEVVVGANTVWDDGNTATKLPGRVIGTCRIDSSGNVTAENGDVQFSASWASNVCTVTLTGNTHGTDYVAQANVLDSSANGSNVYGAHIRSAGSSSIVVQTGRSASGYTAAAYGFTLTLTAGAS